MASDSMLLLCSSILDAMDAGTPTPREVGMPLVVMCGAEDAIVEMAAAVTGASGELERVPNKL